MKQLLTLALICLLSGCDSAGNGPHVSFQHGDDGALAAAISENASISVVSSISEGVVVWDLEFNQKIYQWHHKNAGEPNNTVTLVDIAHDNSHVVTADREAFAIWHLDSGEPLGFWRIAESTIRDIAVSNNGRGILVGKSNGTVIFFEYKTGRRLDFFGHQERINSIAISPNGYYALTGGNDYVAYLWDTRTAQVVYRFDHPSRVTQVALDSKGRFAFTADSQKHARIWDLRTGQQVSQLKYIQRQKIFTAARFSDDGERLLTGSPNRHLILWQVATGKKIREWRVRRGKSLLTGSSVVYAVSFYGDKQVISESSTGWAEIWNR